MLNKLIIAQNGVNSFFYKKGHTPFFGILIFLPSAKAQIPHVRM